MQGRTMRPIAFYLPQYHPIAENDSWWGRGFTEWTNTAKAKPLFRGHYQPHVPSDLGFYDLRVPETRAAQAEMAREAGIEAFCYYHYWFGGRRILERPFGEVLASGEPDFPFCLCWANESWTGVWHGNPKTLLIQQTYPGEDDDRRHFETLLPAFRDKRYIRVDNKPVFLIYRPELMPDPRGTLDLWRRLAVEAGLDGLHIIGTSVWLDWLPKEHGFDAKLLQPFLSLRGWVSRRHNPVKWLRQKADVWSGRPSVQPYREFAAKYLNSFRRQWEENMGILYPCLTHAFDNTPRSAANGFLLEGATPDAYEAFLSAVIDQMGDDRAQERLVFLKSWNEWAEGNHLEPDLRHGHAWLDVVRSASGRVQAPDHQRTQAVDRYAA